MTLLSQMHARRDPACPYVFPGKVTRDAKGKPVWAPLLEVKRAWLSVCITAGLAEEVAMTDAAASR